MLESPHHLRFSSKAKGATVKFQNCQVWNSNSAELSSLKARVRHVKFVIVHLAKMKVEFVSKKTRKIPHTAREKLRKALKKNEGNHIPRTPKKTREIPHTNREKLQKRSQKKRGKSHTLRPKMFQHFETKNVSDDQKCLKWCPKRHLRRLPTRTHRVLSILSLPRLGRAFRRRQKWTNIEFRGH